MARGVGNATRQQQERLRLPSDPITPHYQVNHLIALERGLLGRREREGEGEEGGLLHLSHAASSTFGFEHEFLLGFCYGFFFSNFQRRRWWLLRLTKIESIGKANTHTHTQTKFSHSWQALSLLSL